MSKVQVIEKNGERLFAVIPWEDYERLRDAAEMDDDVRLYDEALARDEERFPLELVDRLLADENPIRVFREYRDMTQRELAQKVGVNPAYLSQIETGRRGGSSKVLRSIANALGVDLDDIVPDK